MNNLLNHYKMRNPLDTIEKIKNFFYSNNFDIKEILNKKTESDTYYCRIQLYKNGQFIIGTNGKGMTEEFSLASGYGELYERFCNKIIFLQSGIAYYKLKDLGLLNNIDTRSFSKICELYPALLEWGNYLFKNDFDSFSKYYLALTTNNPQKDEFISFDDSQNITSLFLDSRLVLKMTGSKGMVAGNTLEEALNQGISELYESWAHENLYLDPPKTYYALSDNILNKLPIWNNICKIKELGYQLYIFDLGYNYNCPVIATYLLDPNNLNVFLNVGSFPILDIAVERTITEIYQGIDSFKEDYFSYNQIPYKTISPAKALANNGNSLDFLCYDENIFNNIKIVDEPSNVFLFSLERQEYTNEELNNYYKKLNKQHNFNFYYKNNSLIPDMTALYIICLDMKPWRGILSQFKNINNIFRKNHLKEIYYHFDLIKKILIENTTTNDIEKFLINFQELISNNNNRDGAFIGCFTGGDLLGFYQSSITTIFLLFNIAFEKNAVLFDSFINLNDNIYTKVMKQYLFIKRYKEAGYSEEDIKQFYSVFKSDLLLTQEDLNNIYNNEYLLNKLFLNLFKKYYNSKDYEDVLKVAFGNLIDN